MRCAPGAIGEEEATLPLRRARVGAVAGVGLPVAGWLIVAVLGLVALMRLVAWDSLQH